MIQKAPFQRVAVEDEVNQDEAASARRADAAPSAGEQQSRPLTANVSAANQVNMPSSSTYCQPTSRAQQSVPEAQSEGSSSSGRGVDIAFLVITGILILFTTLMVWTSAPGAGEGAPTFACFLVSFLAVLPMVYGGIKTI